MLLYKIEGIIANASVKNKRIAAEHRGRKCVNYLSRATILIKDIPKLRFILFLIVPMVL